MDDALVVQEDGIDMIVEELDRCGEVTQDQDKASPRHRGTSKLKQLENALGTPLPAVIRGYATLQDAKLAKRATTRW